MMRRIPLSLVLLLCSALTFAAQAPAKEGDVEKLKAERRAKIVEALLADASELRLPENRAFISAKLGAAIWKYDQERAAALFKTAVASLISAQAIAESSKNPNHQYHDLLTSQSLRPAILNSIGSTDAEYALESLYRSRPVAVQKALAQRGSPAKINNLSTNYPYLAQQEINLEQRLIKLIAEQKPERTLAILKENIKKHLSGETLAMLKKVWEKDPALGNELANDVVDRLISKPFSTGTNAQVNYELINLSNVILAEYIRERSPEERSIAFEESRIRFLAGKLIAAYIQRGASMGYVPLSQLEPIAKRFVPGSFEQLKKAAENTRHHGGLHVIELDGAYTELMKGNPSADTMVAEAKKFSPETRRSMYIGAANKFADAGQYERAVALLNEHFEDDALENAVSSLKWYYASHLSNRGEFDAAESMMLEFNESNRISALTSLAMTIYGKNPEENRSRAIGILQRVRSLLPERAETSNEFSQLLQLINSMAGIEPAEAFRNFEPLVDQINQIAEASAVVHRFQGGYARDGEHLLTHGLNFGVHIDTSLFRTLAEKDFARTSALINTLSRREVRIHILIALLESGM